MRTAGVLLVVFTTAASLGAQATKPTAPAPAPANPPAPTTGSAPQANAPAPLPAEPYTYEPAGRRDPFVSLLFNGSDAHAQTRKGEGPSGMAVADISVRGVMQSRGELIAMVMGPDQKTYVMHQGDKLLDGTIKAVNQQGLVIMQEVNDPLSLVKQREVRKLLRGFEDAK